MVTSSTTPPRIMSPRDDSDGTPRAPPSASPIRPLRINATSTVPTATQSEPATTNAPSPPHAVATRPATTAPPAVTDVTQMAVIPATRPAFAGGPRAHTHPT